MELCKYEDEVDEDVVLDEVTSTSSLVYRQFLVRPIHQLLL